MTDVLRARAPEAAPSMPARLPALTGLRFFAAFMVFAFHLRPLLMKSASYGWLDRVLSPGPVGVSFFFVLSGFVLTWSRRENDGARTFYRRRFARVYPNHFATFFLAAGVIAFEGGRISAKVAGANLLLVQPWIPKSTVFLGMNGVSWSLGCELFFYAMFPFIIGPLTRMSLRARRTLLAGLAGSAILAGVLLLAVPRGAPWLVAFYVFPPVRMIEFVIGILVAREVAGGTAPRVRLWPAVLVTCCAYVAAGWIPAPASVVAVTLIPFTVLIVAAAQASIDGRAGVFASPSLVHLGEISFAFYLVHQLVIRMVQRAIGVHHWGLPTVALLSAWLLVLSLGVAEALYRFVERPCERAIRSRARAPVASEAAA